MMVKKCNVYDVLKVLFHGGYLVWSCTTHDVRHIRLYESGESYGKVIGYVPTAVWDSLVDIGVIVEFRNSRDKYGTIYSFYEFPKGCKR